jgi:tripartite-type tricarboxylate transporter receptor subunit TctC
MRAPIIERASENRRRLMRPLVSLVSAALIVMAATVAARAQDAGAKWPERPVRFIAPFPAGSASDVVARIVGQKLSLLLGQPFVIDNRSGASGEIGTSLLAHAAPDGYTIGIATNSTHVIAPIENAKLSYNPLKDFAPVSMIGASPYVLAVHPGVQARDVGELIAIAKEKPGALNYASAGPASLAHIAGVLFARLANVDLAEISYRSSSAAAIDLAEGRIQLQFGTLAPTLGQIRAKQLRALAVTGTKRSDSLPGIPTLQEAGLAGYDVELWMAIVMPAGSPPAVIERLNRAIRDAISDGDVAQALISQGLEPSASTSGALHERIEAEVTKWRALVAPTDVNALR